MKDDISERDCWGWVCWSTGLLCWLPVMIGAWTGTLALPLLRGAMIEVTARSHESFMSRSMAIYSIGVIAIVVGIVLVKTGRFNDRLGRVEWRTIGRLRMLLMLGIPGLCTLLIVLGMIVTGG